MRKVLVILVVGTIGCNSSDEQKLRDNYECSFKKLYNEENITTYSEGQSSVISGTIKGNLDRLVKVEGYLQGQLDNDFGTSYERVNARTIYDTDFMQNHNAIAEVLCTIETKMNDLDTLSDDYIQLKESYNNKVDNYYNFILNSIPDTTQEIQSHQLRLHEDQNRVKTSHKITIFLNKDDFIGGSIKINGKIPQILPSSSALIWDVLVYNRTVRITGISKEGNIVKKKFILSDEFSTNEINFTSH